MTPLCADCGKNPPSHTFGGWDLCQACYESIGRDMARALANIPPGGEGSFISFSTPQSPASPPADLSIPSRPPTRGQAPECAPAQAAGGDLYNESGGGVECPMRGPTCSTAGTASATDREALQPSARGNEGSIPSRRSHLPMEPSGPDASGDGDGTATMGVLRAPEANPSPPYQPGQSGDGSILSSSMEPSGPTRRHGHDVGGAAVGGSILSSDGTSADYYADKEAGSIECLRLFARYVVPACLIFAAMVVLARRLHLIP